MILQIKELNKEFKRANKSFFAVKDVSLEVNKGDFISIIGHSGSGKSTLINLIAGLLTPTSGNIIIDNKSIINLKDKEMSQIRNNHIGYILQGQSLLSNLTVLENIKLPFDLSKHEGNKDEYALELLNKVGIEYLKNSYPCDLSGGESRRVAIARALINNPSILLADEPTSDLDPENTFEIMKLFKSITEQGTAVLMVTHNLDTTNYGNATYKMAEGILQKNNI